VVLWGSIRFPTPPRQSGTIGRPPKHEPEFVLSNPPLA
jgi:hypothetical protein